LQLVQHLLLSNDQVLCCTKNEENQKYMIPIGQNKNGLEKHFYYYENE